MEKTLTLKIVTPDGPAAEHTCTSLRLTVLDDKSGHGGGSYGIHPGHVPAVFALAEAAVTAYNGSDITYTAHVKGGLASLKGDTLTVLTDSCTVEK